MGTESSELKYYTPAIVSFVFGGLGLLLKLVSMGIYSSVKSEGPLCLIVLLFGTISIPLGGLGLMEIFRYPGKYKGKAMAASGLAFGIICIIIPIVRLISYILTEGIT